MECIVIFKTSFHLSLVGRTVSADHKLIPSVEVENIFTLLEKSTFSIIKRIKIIKY